MVQAVQEALNEDFAVLMDDDVVRPLGELSSVAKSYSGPKDKAAWRPSGDPACQMRAHDAQVGDMTFRYTCNGKISSTRVFT